MHRSISGWQVAHLRSDICDYYSGPIRHMERVVKVLGKCARAPLHISVCGPRDRNRPVLEWKAADPNGGRVDLKIMLLAE
jgi:hypothetical protein